MDLSEVKDPASVKALLDQLRSSQAWQQTIAGTSNAEEPSHMHTDETGQNSGDNSTSATVAALLSQLQAASNNPATSPATITEYSSYTEPLDIPVTSPSVLRPADVRSCTFQQALPHISQLSQDVSVTDTIRNMKQEQVQLENRLWADREEIQRKHEERVQTARKKASLVGAKLTQFEANTLMDSFRRELRKFDLERVLPAWDGMLTRQQATLESLGVPTMYPTLASAELQKQVRVLQVLESALE